jgi:hypothetical protein
MWKTKVVERESYEEIPSPTIAPMSICTIIRIIRLKPYSVLLIRPSNENAALNMMSKFWWRMISIYFFTLEIKF